MSYLKSPLLIIFSRMDVRKNKEKSLKSPWKCTSKVLEKSLKKVCHDLWEPWANMSAKFYEEAHTSLVSSMFTSLFPYLFIVTLTFGLWPPKSIGSILSLWLTCMPSLMKKHTMVYSLSCLPAYFHICLLRPWPLTSKINWVHPLTMANTMPSLMKKHTMVYSLSCLPAYFHICLLRPWPLTSKIDWVHPLTMANMYAKFDEEAHNGLVFIVFTSLFPYLSIVTFTFDLWSPKSIGSIILL